MISGSRGAWQRTRATALSLTAGLAIACGGATSPATTVAPTPTPAPSKVVTLDAGNFDAMVLASGRPSLVEFHSPT